MIGQIDIRRDDERSDNHGDFGLELFRIGTNGKEIARLWRIPPNQSLVWDGRVDFSKIQDEALEGLSLLSERNVSLGEPSDDIRLHVEFVLPERSNRNPKLLSYNLSHRLHKRGYVSTLGRVAELEFARYELVLGNRKNKESFVVTEEKHEAGLGEFGMQMPINRAWNDRVMNWVLAHNGTTPELNDAVSGSELAEAINDRFGLLSG